MNIKDFDIQPKTTASIRQFQLVLSTNNGIFLKVVISIKVLTDVTCSIWSVLQNLKCHSDQLRLTEGLRNEIPGFETGKRRIGKR